VLYSNTYALYTRGWRGIVIDPNEGMKPLFKALRPRDIFVHAGVARAQGVKKYYAFSDGAYNTFDPAEAAIRKGMQYPEFIEERKVAVRPLRDILADQGVLRVDFLNMDIEGMDIEALESYDCSMPPRIMAIESHAFNPDKPMEEPAYRFLRGKSYVLRGFAAYTLIFERVEGE